MGDVFIGIANPNSGDLDKHDIGLNETDGSFHTTNGSLSKVTLKGDTSSTLDVVSEGNNASSTTLRNNNGGVNLVSVSGNFSIQQTDVSGVFEKNWLVGARDNGVSLYHNNAQRITTNNQGVEVSSDGVTDFTVRSNTDDKVQFSMLSNNYGAVFKIKDDGALAVNYDNFGITRTWFEAHRLGAIHLWYGGVSTFQTTHNGAGAITTENLTRDLVAMNGRGGFKMQANADGTSYLKTMRDNLGAASRAIKFIHEGAATVYHNDKARLETLEHGARVLAIDGTGGAVFSVSDSDGGIKIDQANDRRRLLHVESDGADGNEFLVSYKKGETALCHGYNGFHALTTRSNGGVLSGSWSGNVSSVSDKRIKKDIKKIDNALKTILQLNGYTYFKESEIGKGDYKAEIGVIADEVEKIIPELVHNEEGGDNLKSVFYGNGFALTIEAFKELHEVLGKQQRYIEKLEQRIADIEVQK